MATSYTNKKVGSDYEIYRNGDHVATFDPVTDDTTYTHGNDKYATPIGKQVSSIRATAEETPAEETPAEETPAEETPAEETPAEETPAEETPAEETPQPTAREKVLETKIAKQALYITSLEKEIEQLKSERNGGTLATVRTPERYKDVVDDSNAPVQDPNMGDLTPDYIEWARKGGMTLEVFERRYKGRLKDMSYGEESEKEEA